MESRHLEEVGVAIAVVVTVESEAATFVTSLVGVPFVGVGSGSAFAVVPALGDAGGDAVEVLHEGVFFVNLNDGDTLGVEGGGDGHGFVAVAADAGSSDAIESGGSEFVNIDDVGVDGLIVDFFLASHDDHVVVVEFSRVVDSDGGTVVGDCADDHGIGVIAERCGVEAEVVDVDGAIAAGGHGCEEHDAAFLTGVACERLCIEGEIVGGVDIDGADDVDGRGGAVVEVAVDSGDNQVAGAGAAVVLLGVDHELKGVEGDVFRQLGQDDVGGVGGSGPTAGIVIGIEGETTGFAHQGIVAGAGSLAPAGVGEASVAHGGEVGLKRQLLHGSACGEERGGGGEAGVAFLAEGAKLDIIEGAGSQVADGVGVLRNRSPFASAVDTVDPSALVATGGPGDGERGGGGGSGVEMESRGLRAGEFDEADVVDASGRVVFRTAVVSPTEDKLVGARLQGVDDGLEGGPCFLIEEVVTNRSPTSRGGTTCYGVGSRGGCQIDRHIVIVIGWGLTLAAPVEAEGIVAGFFDKDVTIGIGVVGLRGIGVGGTIVVRDVETIGAAVVGSGADEPLVVVVVGEFPSHVVALFKASDVGHGGGKSACGEIEGESVGRFGGTADGPDTESVGGAGFEVFEDGTESVARAGGTGAGDEASGETVFKAVAGDIEGIGGVGSVPFQVGGVGSDIHQAEIAGFFTDGVAASSGVIEGAFGKGVGDIKHVFVIIIVVVRASCSVD